jgi:hypothetical protein
MWKTEFEYFVNRPPSDNEESREAFFMALKAFIESQFEKLINEIPDEPHKDVFPSAIPSWLKAVKQQLRSKWLS